MPVLSFEQRRNNTNVLNSFDPSKTIEFDFGIFANAMTKNVVSSKFILKYFYCLWWGLQQLSSYGQNLSTSTFIGETSIVVLITILDLVLFAHLIGNIETEHEEEEEEEYSTGSNFFNLVLP